MRRVLWISPSLNHYKARFLELLANDELIHLEVLSGTGRKNKGDTFVLDHMTYKITQTSVQKSNFGFSKEVRRKLNKLANDFDWIMIPAEKKNILLILYGNWLRIKYPHIKLLSYNHPILKSGKNNNMLVNKIYSYLIYKLYNRVIFYTEESCRLAIKEKLINYEKAYWANNTLNKKEIEKYYSFSYPPRDAIRILFIGRLIKSKRVDLLLNYYYEIKKHLNRADKELKLDIIGDGPDASIVKEAMKYDDNIFWHGAISDEDKIAGIMRGVSVVFVPGLSGLSINHAFLYGRPYITIDSTSHGPEINYLSDKINGLILKNSSDENIDEIVKLLLDRKLLELYCDNACKKGKELSIDKWVTQVKKALLSE